MSRVGNRVSRIESAFDKHVSCGRSSTAGRYFPANGPSFLAKIASNNRGVSHAFLRFDISADGLFRDIPRRGSEVTPRPERWQLAELRILLSEFVGGNPLD